MDSDLRVKFWTAVRDIISGLGLKWVRRHHSQPIFPLGLILQDWERFGLLGLKAKKLVTVCNNDWPQYELGSQENWPISESQCYDTILQLHLYCRRKFKWSELRYVQIFMALYLDNETHKGFKVWVAQRDNCSKDTKDIFTDLPYGAIQRLNPLQGGANAAPGLLGGTIDSGKTHLGMKRGPAHIQEPLLCTLSYPRGPSLAQLTQSMIQVTNQLPLQFCLWEKFLMEIEEQ